MNDQQQPAQEPWPYVEADRHAWPDAADCVDEEGTHSAELCKAKLEVRKKRAEHDMALTKAQSDAELAVEQEYYKGILEVAKGAIDRARASADTVQKAAAAIATLYVGVLGIAFSVADNPLPEKALFAAVLLGLAILLSTAFLAYLPDPEGELEQAAEQDPGSERPPGELLTSMFIRWTRTAALERGRLLRGAVVALAGAVALLPAPFVGFGEKEAEKSEIAWPAPDAAAGETKELQTVLYTAQVAEIAEQRKEPVAVASDDKWWTYGFIVALLATAAVMVRWPRRDS